MLLEQDSDDPLDAVFAAVPRDVIEAAMARVDALARSPDDPYFDELLAQHRGTTSLRTNGLSAASVVMRAMKNCTAFT